MPAGGGENVHGPDREERRRLARLSETLNPRALRELELSPRDRVLDLGCGTGLLAEGMAQAVGPSGFVLGVECDNPQLAAALQHGREAGEFAAAVEFRRGEIESPPLKPGEWGSFDVAHCRFVLSRVHEPQAVVEAMAAAVAPGGRVVVEDDDHDLLRLWPRVPSIERLWMAYVDSRRELGFDPFVGRRSVALLYSAALELDRCTMLYFGGWAGSDDFDFCVENLGATLRGASGAILQAGAITEEELSAALEELKIWGERPDAAYWGVTFRAEGRRAAGDAA